MKTVLTLIAAVMLAGGAPATAQEAGKEIVEKEAAKKKKAPCKKGEHGCGVALAVGQNPALLAITRASNAGIGNGMEGKIDADPGNSGFHNQAEECFVIQDCDL